MGGPRRERAERTRHGASALPARERPEVGFERREVEREHVVREQPPKPLPVAGEHVRQGIVRVCNIVWQLPSHRGSARDHAPSECSPAPPRGLAR